MAVNTSKSMLALGTVVALLCLVTAGSSYLAIRDVDRIDRTWHDYERGVAAKTEILSDIRDAIGYGGAIHEFKNFVLRQDRLRIARIQWGLMRVIAATIAYEQLANAREKSALADLRTTLIAYVENVESAEYMASLGAPPKEIDRVVRVDDEPALRAIATLAQELTVARTVSARSVDRSVRSHEVVVIVGSVLMGAFLLLLVGGFLRFVTVDRTRRALEHETRSLAETVERQNELMAVHRQFASMVSHEIRTPLAIIDGTARGLIRKIGRAAAPETITAGLNKVRSSVTRLTDFMESVLDASRLEAGTLEIDCETCSIRTILQEVVTAQSQISGTHEFSLDIDRLPDRMCADPRLLHSVFSNLVSNAVKYSGEGTAIEIVGDRDGDAVVVTVRDYGVGIPKEELDKLFERYFRASSSIGTAGTGIGLDLVKNFVELHDGTVSAESTLGEGTAFTVRLPTARGEATQPARAEDPRPSRATAHLGELELLAS